MPAMLLGVIVREVVGAIGLQLDMGMRSEKPIRPPTPNRFDWLLGPEEIAEDADLGVIVGEIILRATPPAATATTRPRGP